MTTTPIISSLDFTTLFALGAQQQHVQRQRRRHPRHSVFLPMCLRPTADSAWLPALLLNFSASGLLALVETRVLSAFPVAVGMRVHGLLFLDVLEGEEVELEVTRVEQRGENAIGLGCQFVSRGSH